MSLLPSPSFLAKKDEGRGEDVEFYLLRYLLGKQMMLQTLGPVAAVQMFLLFASRPDHLFVWPTSLFPCSHEQILVILSNMISEAESW